LLQARIFNRVLYEKSVNYCILVEQVGGYDGASRQCLSTVENYNPETDTWQAVAEMSARRSGAGKT